MTTHTIEWYQTGLKNARATEHKMIDELSNLQEKIIELSKRNDFLEMQIQEAIKSGKTKFDSDRYLNRKDK